MGKWDLLKKLDWRTALWGLANLHKVVDFQSIDLYGEKLFSIVAIKTPFESGKGTIKENEACFTYVLQGQAHSYSELHEIKVEAGQGSLAKCGTFVSKLSSKEEKGIYSAIIVNLKRGVLKKVYGEEIPAFMMIEGDKVVRNGARIANSNLMKSCFDGLQAFFDNKEALTEEILVLKLKEIMLLLHQSENSREVSEIMSHLYTKRTFTFKEVVDAHITSSISIPELASLCNCSLSTFKREFKKIYSDTPSNYIINKRTEKAAELLRISDESITNIAYDCGFKSVAHFSRYFTDKYGINPSEHRSGAATA